MVAGFIARHMEPVNQMQQCFEDDHQIRVDSGNTSKDELQHVRKCDNLSLDSEDKLAAMLTKFKEEDSTSTHWIQDSDNKCLMSNGEDN